MSEVLAANAQEERSYRWVQIPGTFQFRAECIPCDRKMTWAMEIRPEYGRTINKTTVKNGDHQVIYNGRPVQVYKCGGCGQSVVR